MPLARRIERAMLEARAQAQRQWARAMEPAGGVLHAFLAEGGFIDPLIYPEQRRLHEAREQLLNYREVWGEEPDGTTPAPKPDEFAARIQSISLSALRALTLPSQWQYLKECELLFGRPGCRGRFLAYAANLLQVPDDDRLRWLLESQAAGVPDHWLTLVEGLEQEGIWAGVEEE